MTYSLFFFIHRKNAAFQVESINAKSLQTSRQAAGKGGRAVRGGNINSKQITILFSAIHIRHQHT